jgi:hypothetical protein
MATMAATHDRIVTVTGIGIGSSARPRLEGNPVGSDFAQAHPPGFIAGHQGGPQFNPRTELNSGAKSGRCSLPQYPLGRESKLEQIAGFLANVTCRLFSLINDAGHVVGS